jgi:hypothetical protein
MKKIILIIFTLFFISSTSYSQLKTKEFKCDFLHNNGKTVATTLTFTLLNKKILYPSEIRARQEGLIKDWVIVEVDEFFDQVTAESKYSQIKLFGFLDGKFDKKQGVVEIRDSSNKGIAIRNLEDDNINIYYKKTDLIRAENCG